eukprot:GHRR01020539.1.p1 GENE.GHRR01020539.1~~GHRR01020539.1.p1  ORF type:complete len:855 (+),score=361.96 GHRR01020539.1:259-2823(+)
MLLQMHPTTEICVYWFCRNLCSYTHPVVGAAMFGSLNALKRKVQEQHKLYFCDLCIKGRKVFISEQVLYTKSDLDRHHRTGDDAGPLAEAGFKGHPLCRFCKRRFYDGDELYKHMEGQHEHCFICRRLHSNKFVYFKDYAELEEHFQHQHHPCPHPACLERKFVVFADENELKRHFAAEHGNDLNMSRAQRRQALTLNIQLNYSRQEQQQQQADMGRPGVVIGGAHSLPRQGGMRHSRSDGAMQAAVQASIETSQLESAMRQSAAAPDGPSSVTFSAEDFPSVSGQSSDGAMPLGTWVGSSAQGGTALTSENFPALPTMSRNQRRKQRERERSSAATFAGRLAAANAPIRVVNKAAPGSTAEAPSSSNSSTGMVRQSSSTGDLASASSHAVNGLLQEQEGSVSSNAASDVEQQENFPALSSSAAAVQAHPAWVPVRRSKPARPGQQAASRSSSRAAAPPSISDFPSLTAALPASKQPAGAWPKPAAAARSAGNASISSSNVQSVAAAVAAAGGVSDELKAANKALIERCKAALSEEGFRDFREQSGKFMQGDVSAGAYHKRVVQLGLLQLVPQLAALCPDADKRAALVTAHRQYLQDYDPDAAAAGKGWVPPEAAMAALQEVEQQGSWACEHCTLINAPSSSSCGVCSAPRLKQHPAAASKGSAGRSSGSGGRNSSSSDAAMQAPLWQPAAAAPAVPAAVPMAAKLRAAASPLPAQRPASADVPAAAAAEQETAIDSWPTLGGPSSSSSNRPSSGGASTSGAAEQAALRSSMPSSSSCINSPLQQGKKKKGTKTSLQELLTSGKTHPQNAWTQQTRLQQVTQAPAGQQTSMGQWKATGKLAKQVSAANSAWSKS